MNNKDFKLNFRNLKIEDIKNIIKIYNFYINFGFSNFEDSIMSNEDFYTLCKGILNSKLPFIVCEIDNKIIGFAYLNKFRKKNGYRFALEDSIYIDYSFIGRGIGNKLLKELIKIALLNSDIRTIIAVISSKNSSASIKIHEKNGFNIIGTLKDVGFKKDKWLDAILMQKILYEKN